MKTRSLSRQQQSAAAGFLEAATIAAASTPPATKDNHGARFGAATAAAATPNHPAPTPPTTTSPCHAMMTRRRSRKRSASAAAAAADSPQDEYQEQSQQKKKARSTTSTTAIMRKNRPDRRLPSRKCVPPTSRKSSVLSAQQRRRQQQSRLSALQFVRARQAAAAAAGSSANRHPKIAQSTLRHLGATGRTAASGPLSYIVAFLNELDLHALEQAYCDVRQFSLKAWHDLRQRDMVSIHCAKWRHSHYTTSITKSPLFENLAAAIRPKNDIAAASNNGSSSNENRTTTTATTRTDDDNAEWLCANHRYQQAPYMVYAKDYVQHVLHTRQLIQDCENSPVVPVDMTIGDLARSGYHVFIHWALHPPPPPQWWETIPRADSVCAGFIDAGAIAAARSDGDRKKPAVETFRPEAVKSSDGAVKKMAVDDNQKEPPREQRGPLEFDAFRKVRQAVYYPADRKMLLKFENPVTHFLGVRSEWPQVEEFNAWHQIDWTILNQLKQSRRLGAEVESVLSYERACQAKLKPLLANMEITITLPKHCLDKDGNSVYPTSRVQQRAGLARAREGGNPAAAPMVQHQRLQAQLQRLQQETANLRRQLNGLVNGLAANIHQNQAREALDRAAQRLQHAGAALLNQPLAAAEVQQLVANAAAAGGVAARPAADNNNNANNNVNDVIQADNDNDGDNGDVANNAPEIAAAADNNDDGAVAMNQQIMINRRARRDALRPSADPPSPETFIAVGRCRKLQWTQQYKTEIRQTILQSLPPEAPNPMFTADLNFYEKIKQLGVRRTPPSSQQGGAPDGGATGVTVLSTSSSEATISNRVLPPVVAPWEISIPVSPTLNAIFEVYRLQHPKEAEADEARTVTTNATATSATS